MTCIVGARDKQGKVFISADNRISWRYFQTGDRVHVDDLQKIYFVQPFLIVAFATSNLQEVQALMAEIRPMAAAAWRDGSLETQELVKCQDSVLRLLKKRTPTEGNSELMVAFAPPERNDLNKLYYCHYSSRELKRLVDVSPGDLVIGGSVFREAEFGRFETDVVQKAFAPEGIEMLQRVALFNACYTDFQKGLSEEWHSVGQAFCSVCTNEAGVALTENSRTLSLDRGGLKADFSVVWEIVDGQPTQLQRNNLTNEQIPLVQVDKYDFSQPSADDHTFQILARR